MSPMPARMESALPASMAHTDIPPPLNPHFANGDDEIALARLADDGGLPSPPAEPEAPPAPAAAPISPDLSPLAPPAATAAHTHSLEQRVRRLEEALALLQEQRAAETRPPAPPAAPRAPERPPEAKLAPVSAAPATPTSTAVLLDVGKRLLGAAAQVVPPPSLAPLPSVAHPADRSGVLWLLWDTWAEARAIMRMFVDPRYHLPWSARMLPLLVLAAILTSKYWIPGSSIPVLGDWLLVKLIDLLLAFLLFKWLGHEARRYRQTSPDLPPSLRL